MATQMCDNMQVELKPGRAKSHESPLAAAVHAIESALSANWPDSKVAQALNLLSENDYWRREHLWRIYYDDQYTYEEDYAPAYGLGYVTRLGFIDRDFEEVEPQLRNHWALARGRSLLPWSVARDVVADAWARYHEIRSQRNPEF